MKPHVSPLLAVRGQAGLALFAASVLAANASAADQVLFDFSKTLDLNQLVATDTSVSHSRETAVLSLKTGHKETWPGIVLRAPAGHWDLSDSADVSLRVRNSGTNPVTVFCRVDNPGADGTERCVTGSAGINPSETKTLRVPLPRLSDDKLAGKLFGMRGYPVSAGGSGTIDPANVTQLLVFVSQPKQDYQFEVGDIRATGTWHSPTAWTRDATPFFPFLDTFGQYRHKDWPGKVKSLADLLSRRAQEAAELGAKPGPKEWDRYGGWAAGPRLQATGFFRTEKVQGKWWLVDPDGRLFFSHGIDCVGSLDATPIEERENWFQEFPGDRQEFAAFRSRQYALKGHYAGRTTQCFSFAGANLARKYGTDWEQIYRLVVHQRLRSWGLNTIANWSTEPAHPMRLTPYTDNIGSDGARMIEGSEGYWGKFPDVFDPGFVANLRRTMETKRSTSAGDPWCLGYFSDNEMSWGDEISIALGALRSGPDQPAKRALIAGLQLRYGKSGSQETPSVNTDRAGIARLNEAWGTQYSSWETFLAVKETPNLDRARADLAAFYTDAAERYFRTVREVIRTVAPHQLYLGCRFAWVNDRAAAAAAKYCDVVSYNLYQHSVADFKFNGGADVPLLIGEFHFGALDRGMFHTGLVPVADQQARAQAYREYVLGALRHPQFVGCHWFQYQDEPVTGRAYDEENYQIGFVDVADTPYRETIEACRELGYGLYRMAGNPK